MSEKEQLKLTKLALNEIRRLYMRSNKRDKYTCYKMYLMAGKTLEEIELREYLASDLGKSTA